MVSMVRETFKILTRCMVTVFFCDCSGKWVQFKRCLMSWVLFLSDRASLVKNKFLNSLIETTTNSDATSAGPSYCSSVKK